jgi:hypothetical protein
MKFPSTIRRNPGGEWTVRHESKEVGAVEVTASTREQATEKLIGEIRYRLELCPCTGESYQHIRVELIEQ